MMNHISFFLNNRIVDDKSRNLASVTTSIGDWFLAPVRCLYNGKHIKIFKGGCTQSEREYPKITQFQIVRSIVLLLPAVIIGSAFKVLGYLSGSIREKHKIAYTNVNSKPLVQVFVKSRPEVELSVSYIIDKNLDKPKCEINYPHKSIIKCTINPSNRMSDQLMALPRLILGLWGKEISKQKMQLNIYSKEPVDLDIQQIIMNNLLCTIIEINGKYTWTYN